MEKRRDSCGVISILKVYLKSSEAIKLTSSLKPNDYAADGGRPPASAIRRFLFLAYPALTQTI
jgi:hypothetical protein